MIENVLGSTLPQFIGLTLVLFGGAGFMTGQSVARGWRPFDGVALFYCLLMAAGNRFLAYALFDRELLHVPGLLVDFAVIVTFAFIGHRVTRAYKMVAQYPWLYRRSGLFGWRAK